MEGGICLRNTDNEGNKKEGIEMQIDNTNTCIVYDLEVNELERDSGEEKGNKENDIEQKYQSFKQAKYQYI